MIKKIFLSIILIFFVCILPCFGDNTKWIEILDKNDTWINWTDYTIYAKLNATTEEFFPDYITLKQKKISLMNKLYNATLNIEVKKGLKIKDLINKESKILLWKSINNTPYMQLVKISKNSYILQTGVNILGEFLKNIFPMPFILKQENISTIQAKIQDYFKGYTGVVIEISTDKFKPSPLLWIYSHTNELLFSPKIANYNILTQKGICMYLNKFNKEVARSRIGTNPLFLESDDIYQENTHSLILNKNSDFYLKFPSISNLIKNGKLVITKKSYYNLEQEKINEFIIEN